MKKIYLTPSVKTKETLLKVELMNYSLTGNTGDGTIPGGGDDSGGEHDPDAKQRGGLDGWGDLW